MSECALCFEDVSFSYAAAPGAGEGCRPVLDGVSLQVGEGAFALLVGATGSGKSTLLRLAKPEVSPAGGQGGRVLAWGRDVRSLSPRESAATVALVAQGPDDQLVCDTVWHELSFALENLGVPEPEMRRRVAETCVFLGIEGLFRAHVAELSGGQRQMVSLAAALALHPRALLLDEPTAMLDPVAERGFLSLLFRANRELGVTVVVATHSPAPMVDYATCAFELVDGRVGACDPASLRGRGGQLPLAPAGRAGFGVAGPDGEPVRRHDAPPRVLGLRDVWQRYDRDDDWVLRGTCLDVRRSEVRALVGANGCGKSTLLLVAAGVEGCSRGRVQRPLAGSQALLPQSPQAVLACETVAEELAEWAPRDADGADGGLVAEALWRLGLADARDRHPYDLSGGQRQLLALEKVLMARPGLLLLDEPTKGLDDDARLRVARRVLRARDEGATVLLASHDMGLVRAVADSVSLVFDGRAIDTEPCADFFAGSWLWR